MTHTHTRYTQKRKRSEEQEVTVCKTGKESRKKGTEKSVHLYILGDLKGKGLCAFSSDHSSTKQWC